MQARRCADAILCGCGDLKGDYDDDEDVPPPLSEFSEADAGKKPATRQCLKPTKMICLTPGDGDGNAIVDLSSSDDEPPCGHNASVELHVIGDGGPMNDVIESDAKHVATPDDEADCDVSQSMSASDTGHAEEEGEPHELEPQEFSNTLSAQMLACRAYLAAKAARPKPTLRRYAGSTIWCGRFDRRRHRMELTAQKQRGPPAPDAWLRSGRWRYGLAWPLRCGCLLCDCYMLMAEQTARRRWAELITHLHPSIFVGSVGVAAEPLE